MALQAQKFAFAATVTMAVVYVVCAVFTAIAPDLAVKFLGWMLHVVNVEKFAGDVEVTPQGFFLGLLPIFFYAHLSAWLFPALYNRFLGRNA